MQFRWGFESLKNLENRGRISACGRSRCPECPVKKAHDMPCRLVPYECAASGACHGRNDGASDSVGPVGILRMSGYAPENSHDWLGACLPRRTPPGARWPDHSPRGRYASGHGAARCQHSGAAPPGTGPRRALRARVRACLGTHAQRSPGVGRRLTRAHSDPPPQRGHDGHALENARTRKFGGSKASALDAT